LRRRRIPKQTRDEPDKRIIVCRVSRSIVGLSINTLRERIALSKEEWSPTPELVSTQMDADVISGIAKVGERIIPILDVEHILIRKEVTQLSALRE
jgi:chemotaxis signal transduction protein